MLLRHNIDRLGRASSASNKSGSCASILTLHTLVGAGVVRCTSRDAETDHPRWLRDASGDWTGTCARATPACT